MVHGLGEACLGVIAVSVEKRLRDACVKLCAARRWQVLIDHLADQDVGKRAAIADFDEHIAAHGLRGEITHGGERLTDERRCDAEIERSPEYGSRVEELACRR
jgi:hypothetical protein